MKHAPPAKTPSRHTGTDLDRQTEGQTGQEERTKEGSGEQMWPVKRKNKVLESVQARPKSAAQRWERERERESG